MKWIEFGILEVANLCGLNIAPYSLGQREVKAQCPFCDDKKHHLNINTENNQWYCFKCGSYGNDVSLYAQIHGISNRDAVRELKKNGLGGKRGQIYTRNVNPAPAMRSLYDRHDVYYELLRMLHLDTQHRNNLISRGLSVENIRQFMYKSVPRDQNIRRVVIRRLLDKYDLSGIPGFYREYGEWKMYVPKTGGFFIPVCDSDGYIQGLRMRLDSGDSRYKWFSTANFPEGTGV